MVIFGLTFSTLTMVLFVAVVVVAGVLSTTKVVDGIVGIDILLGFVYLAFFVGVLNMVFVWSNGGKTILYGAIANGVSFSIIVGIIACAIAIQAHRVRVRPSATLRWIGPSSVIVAFAVIVSYAVVAFQSGHTSP